MVILDKPYASPQLLEWLERSQHPVLRNAFSRCEAFRSGRTLNLVDAAEAAVRLDAGERVYTNSENALAWISEHVDNGSLTRAIATFKDKVAMRKLLSQLDEGFFFCACTADQLPQLDFAELAAHVPFVVKPARGFCSMGVHVVTCRAEWDAALVDFARNAATWAAMYPDSVVAGSDFILEQYITGQEYALDAYFDEAGAAHVLNVLRHDFAGPEDTSDRIMDDDVLARLLSFNNVIVTSHQGFFTREAVDNIARTTMQNIKDFSECRRLENEVRAEPENAVGQL